MKGKNNLLIIIYFFLLIFSLEIFNTPIGGVSVTYYRILWGFVFIIDIILVLKRREKKFFYLVLFVLLSSLIFALLRYLTQMEIPMNYMGYYLSTPIIYLFFLNSRINKKTYNIILLLLLVFLVSNLLIGVFEYLLNIDLLTTHPGKMVNDGLQLWGLSGIRVNGFFYDNISYFLCNDLLVVILFLFRDKRKSRLLNIFLNISIILILLLTSIICFFSTNILAILFFTILYVIRTSKNIIIKIASISLVLLLVLGYMLFLKTDTYFSAKSNDGIYTRLGGYLYNLEVIEAHPLLGTNLYESNTSEYEDVYIKDFIKGNYDPHNLIIEIVRNGGLFLGILFTMFLLSIFKNIKNCNILLRLFFIAYIIVIGFDFGIPSLINFNNLLLGFLMINSNYNRTKKAEVVKISSGVVEGGLNPVIYGEFKSRGIKGNGRRIHQTLHGTSQ
jgi:hypothetical protein